MSDDIGARVRAVDGLPELIADLIGATGPFCSIEENDKAMEWALRAYRAGQAATPDGPRAWALPDGTEVEEQWEVYDERDDEFKHAQTTEKFARAAARELDLALRRRQIITTPWEPVDATPAADGQDGRDG